MARKKSKNVNAKGRSLYDTSPFLRLGHNMLSSPNFRALNGNAIKVLLEIASHHNGFNNGRIGMSLDKLAKTLHLGKTTIHRACEDLEYYGFLKLKKRGHFIGRRANEWEVTFLQSEGYHPTHEWKKERPRRRKRPARSGGDAIGEAVNSLEFFEQRRAKIEARYLNEI